MNQKQNAALTALDKTAVLTLCPFTDLPIPCGDIKHGNCQGGRRLVFGRAETRRHVSVAHKSHTAVWIDVTTLT